MDIWARDVNLKTWMAHTSVSLVMKFFIISLSFQYQCDGHPNHEIILIASREKVLIETASIAGGVTVAVLLMVIIIIVYYSYLRWVLKQSHRQDNVLCHQFNYLRQRKKKESVVSWELDTFDTIARRPFSRAESLRRVVPRNMPFIQNEHHFGLQDEDRRLPNVSQLWLRFKWV